MTTSLDQQYRRQARWRRWQQIIDLLPLAPDQTVLDLGCAIGEQSALLAARGARVIGIDGNAQLLAAARARGLAHARFELADLSHPPAFELPPIDGLWCSFVAAYFPALDKFLRTWFATLRPGAWIALVEIDDLFAHEPLSTEVKATLAAFVDEALDAGRYHFRCGRELAPALRRLGCIDVVERVIEDDELGFTGAADPEVLEAWAQRLDRMKGLQAFAGPAFAQLRDELLSCLASPAHVTRCKVFLALARR